MVLATQNPIEQEGTYPLPEAQTDRFLMHVLIGYPTPADEEKILRLVRGEQAAGAKPTPSPKIPQDAIFKARAEIDALSTSDAVEAYIVGLIAATRDPKSYGDKLGKWIALGGSPRGSLALDRCSQVYAWLKERTYVTPEDVQAILHDCLRHRVALSYDAAAEGETADAVLDELVRQVAVAI
jgi:MoxR-like ATPase